MNSVAFPVRATSASAARTFASTPNSSDAPRRVGIGVRARSPGSVDSAGRPDSSARQNSI